MSLVYLVELDWSASVLKRLDDARPPTRGSIRSGMLFVSPLAAAEERFQNAQKNSSRSGIGALHGSTPRMCRNASMQ